MNIVSRLLICYSWTMVTNMLNLSPQVSKWKTLISNQFWFYSNSNEKYYDKCLVIVCPGNAFFRIHNNHEIQSFKQQILENKNALIVLNLSILNHFIKLHFKNKCKWLFECSKPTAFDRLQPSFLQTNKTPINTKEIWKKKII